MHSRRWDATILKLTPSNMHVYGFNRVESRVEETIRMSKIMGREPKEATQILNLLVVKTTSTYNVILGMIGLNTPKAVASR